MVALGGAFTACNDPASSDNPEDQTEIGIAPIEVSDDVAAFFNNYQTLKALGWAFFDKISESGLGHISPDADSCVMINSAEQLPELEGLEYPEIDFDSATLILGVAIAKSGGYYIASQSLSLDNDGALMSVGMNRRREEDTLYHMTVTPIYFWGIYPKISATTIDITVTREI